MDRYVVWNHAAGGWSNCLPVERNKWLRDRLDRPIRVCGMVVNNREPGGGPFWVDRNGMVSKQIVEFSQVSRIDSDQVRLSCEETHFNPVEMVCSLRDVSNHSYDLSRYVDPETVIVTEKSENGIPVRVLEWPGLWNGAMAGWNSLFVEIELPGFQPVKTVFDLLRK